MSLPSFSIVIPTYNRPQALVACLESFKQLAYPAELWELIVVNDGGDESFTAVTPALKQALPLKLVDSAHGGPAKARNLGASHAKNEFLAFTDDDCQIFPDWLNQFVTGFEQSQCDALGGRSVTPFDQNIAERAWQHLTDFLYDFMQDERGNALLLISNNVAYKRHVFETIGGFNETFPLAAAEDMEMSFRLLKHGFKQQYYPPAKVWHYHHLTIWGHLKQQFRYGRGGFYFNQLRQTYAEDALMALYFRRWFYNELKKSYRQKNLPISSELVSRSAQYAYRFGVQYQSLRHRFSHE
ncbi:MAG: glycosyltransferase [Chloroflexota bacterium]